MKIGDYILLGIMLFFLGAAGCGYLTNSFALGIIGGVLTCMLYVLPVLFFRRKRGVAARDIFTRDLLIQGKQKSNELLLQLFPLAEEKEKDKYQIEGTLYVNCIRFSSAGEEDIAAAYRYAAAEGISKVKVLTSAIDRKALALANSLSFKVNLVDIKAFYTALKKAGLLPKPAEKSKHKGKLRSALKALPLVPPKYFIFASISTAAMSFFLPFRLYYLIFAGINAAIGLYAVIKKGFVQSETL